MSLKSTVTKAAVMGVALIAATAISPTVAHAGEPVAAPVRHGVAPVAELQPLNALIGSWNCTGAVTSPDGSQQAFDTTSTASFILGGHFMRWQEVNTIGGTPIASAEYLWGWDAQHQNFTEDRFDDSGQRGAQTTPGWAGNVLTSIGALGQPDGSSIQVTTTLTKTTKTAFTVRSVVDLGAAAGGATVVSESSCTR
jgi:hypothetical protein